MLFSSAKNAKLILSLPAQLRLATNTFLVASQDSPSPRRLFSVDRPKSDESPGPPEDPSPSSSASAEGKKKVTLKKKSDSSFPRIYTRTGDAGKSSLFTGERRDKSDAVFEALGATDELSSNIGLSMEFGRENDHPYIDQLQRIQCLLQDIGSALATPHSSARDIHVQRTHFNPRHTKELEEWIDQYSEKLPPLQNFILPGGGRTSASLHVCRSVCRRAERKIVPLVMENEIDAEVLKYVNRLSDFLFTIARLAARTDKMEETIYRRVVEEATYEPGPDGVWKKTVKKKD